MGGVYVASRQPEYTFDPLMTSDGMQIRPPSITTPDGQIGKQCKLHKAGQWVLSAEYGFDMRPHQRSQVRSPTLPTSENLHHSGGKVSYPPNPANPGAATAGLHEFTNLVGEQHIRKIHSRAEPESVVTPSTSVDVEQLIIAIARIEFVLQLHQSVVVDCSQKACRQDL